MFVFVETVGLAAPVTASAQLLARQRDTTFAAGLRTALLGWLGLYFVGVAALWGAGIGTARTPLLLVAGAVAVLGLGVLPLAVGRWLVQRSHRVDDDTALRLTAAGWPLTMTVAFIGFFTPRSGHVLHLGEPTRCLLGFCGVSVASVLAVAVLGVGAAVGPGVVGVVQAGKRR